MSTLSRHLDLFSHAIHHFFWVISISDALSAFPVQIDSHHTSLLHGVSLVIAFIMSAICLVHSEAKQFVPRDHAAVTSVLELLADRHLARRCKLIQMPCRRCAMQCTCLSIHELIR